MNFIANAKVGLNLNAQISTIFAIAMSIIVIVAFYKKYTKENN